MNPAVSIVMPSYNCRKYIAPAIESVLNQTYDNFEMIIVDDGSTDGTDAIINKYESNKHITVITQPNAGRHNACNNAIRNANGSLIAFCDSDDLLREDKIALQVRAMQEHPEVGLIHTARTAIDENGKSIGHSHARDTGAPAIEVYEATKKLFHHNYICGPTVMIRRECFNEVGYFNETLKQNEDQELYLRISTRYKFGYLNQELYKYRKHGGQITKKRDERELYKEKALRLFMEQYPDAVSKSDLNIAFANIHKSRGHECLKLDKNPRQARREFYKALSYQPLKPSVWFRIFKSFFALDRK